MRRLALLVLLVACKRKAQEPPPALPTYDTNEPVVLVTGEPGPSALAIDATDIYWNNFGKSVVRKLPRAGGKPVTLYEGSTEIGGRNLALDRDGVYFDDAFAIKRVPKAGGAAAAIGTLAYMPNRFVADDDAAYSVASFPVTRHPRHGAEQTLAQDDEAWDIAVDATHVYWLGKSGVKRIPKAGGKVEVLARGTFRFGRITLSETDVYWSDAVLESVFAVPKAGGAARFVAKAWSIAAKALVADRGAVWMVTSDGTLARLDPTTHDVTAYANGLARGGIADKWLDLAIAGDDAYIATGGQTLVGTGPVVVDLTKPNPNLPQYTYDGAILRVSLKPPAHPSVHREDKLSVGWVWFTGTTLEMQDPANATHGINELDPAQLRAGAIGLRIVGVTNRVTAEVARQRAEVVATAIRSTLGDKVKLAIAIEPAGEGQPDVLVELEVSDVLAAMKP